MMKIKNFQHAKNLRFLSMNKKGFLWAMTHPVALFIIGLIIGAGIVYYLGTKDMLPNLPVP